MNYASVFHIVLYCARILILSQKRSSLLFYNSIVGFLFCVFHQISIIAALFVVSVVSIISDFSNHINVT